MADKIQTVRDDKDTQAVVRNLDQISDEVKSVTDRVEVLEAVEATKNTEQSTVAKVSYSTITISATYTQSEIQQLTADIKTVADKVDALLASLQAADILS